MRLDQSAQPAFARHETFHPRYGWLKKAYDGAAADPRVFTHEQATVLLGVGKNMVRAIRFWGLATRVLTHAPDPHRLRLPLTVPSRIGATMFADDGWDPYCEDPASLWLFHWWMLAPESLLPVWWVAIHDFSAVEFTEEQLEGFVADHIAGTPGWEAPHPSSLQKDVSCFLRMYTAQGGSARSGIDDWLDCPFRDLGLVRPVPGQARTYRFVIGDKPTLPADVVAFAALDFLARTDAGSQTITLSRLANEPGGPGRAFRLTETALTAALERATGSGGLRLASPAGIPQLSFDGDPAELATHLLHRYYSQRRTGLTRPYRVAGAEAGEPATAQPTLDATIDPPRGRAQPEAPSDAAKVGGRP